MKKVIKIHNRILNATFITTVIWHILIYVRMPSLLWLPSFMGTWFYSKGLIYYKDFLQLHFLLPHIIAFPFYKITGWNINVEPVLALAVAIITTFILFRVGKKLFTSLGVILSILFFSILYWYATTWVQYTGEAVSGLLLLLTTAIFIKLINSKVNSNKLVFFFGILSGLTLLSGQIVGITIAISFVLLFIYKRGSLLLSLVGAAIPIISVSLYFVIHGAFKDFFFWNITYYITYAKLAKSSGGSIPWIQVILFFLPGILLLVDSIKNRLWNKIRVTLITLSLSGIPFVIASIFHPHHYLFILPIISLALAEFSKNFKKERLLTFVFTIFILYQSTFIIGPWYTSKLSGNNTLKNLNNISKDTDAVSFVNWLKSNEKDKTAIIVGDPFMYFLADILPANRYYSALPWHYIPLSETSKEFDVYPPDIYIIDVNYLNRFYTSWLTPEVGDFIKNRVEACYRKVYTTSPWEVWQRYCQGK